MSTTLNSSQLHFNSSQLHVLKSSLVSAASKAHVSDAAIDGVSTNPLSAILGMYRVMQALVAKEMARGADAKNIEKEEEVLVI